MGRNGGALKRPSQIPSTVKDTCTEAETVQESLWKSSNQTHNLSQGLILMACHLKNPMLTGFALLRCSVLDFLLIITDKEWWKLNAETALLEMGI